MKQVPGVRVLFVCTSNICRSPTVEGVFRSMAAQSGLTNVQVDSAATHDFHVGAHPDERAILAARRRGIDIAELRARMVCGADFERFDWILAMDRTNLATLEAMRPKEFAGWLGLLLDLVPESGLKEVPDPYFGGVQGFERVLDLAEAASAALVGKLAAARGR